MTDLHVRVVEQRSIATAQIRGEVDIANTSVVSQRVLGGVSADALGVVLDLAGVNYIDSTGVRMVFELARTLAAGRRRLAIYLPTDSPLHRLFSVTNVTSVAPIFPSLEAARAAVEEVPNGSTT